MARPVDLLDPIRSRALLGAFAAVGALLEVLPNVPIVVISILETAGEVVTWVEAGATGYIPKRRVLPRSSKALQGRLWSQSLVELIARLLFASRPGFRSARVRPGDS